MKSRNKLETAENFYQLEGQTKFRINVVFCFWSMIECDIRGLIMLEHMFSPLKEIGLLLSIFSEGQKQERTNSIEK